MYPLDLVEIYPKAKKELKNSSIQARTSRLEIANFRKNVFSQKFYFSENAFLKLVACSFCGLGPREAVWSIFAAAAAAAAAAE